MFKKILISAVMLMLIGITIFSLVNMPLKLNSAVESKSGDEPLNSHGNKQMINTLKVVNEKIQQKYQSVDVSINSEKELVIKVKGNNDYFNSVKNDIESMVKNVIKSSPLKENTIVVEKNGFPFQY